MFTAEGHDENKLMSSGVLCLTFIVEDGREQNKYNPLQVNFRTQKGKRKAHELMSRTTATSRSCADERFDGNSAILPH